jgi:hypothetical protein
MTELYYYIGLVALENGKRASENAQGSALHCGSTIGG